VKNSEKYTISNRFSKIRDFDTVFKTGSRIKAGQITLVWGKMSPENSLSGMEMAVVASKKSVSKRAVDRNLVKRRLKAVFRLHLSQFEPDRLILLNHHFYCWLGSRALLQMPFPELVRITTGIWTQVLTQLEQNRNSNP
jgi:ribonuclease P protein component